MVNHTANKARKLLRGSTENSSYSQALGTPTAVRIWDRMLVVEGSCPNYVAFLMAQMVKNLQDCNAGDLGSIPGFGGSVPGGGHGNPLQYFCLENTLDRGAWQATVHVVANS